MHSTQRIDIKEKANLVNSNNVVSLLKNQKHEGGLRIKGRFKQSSKKKPLISIITVVFNGKQHLEETIQSVLNQTYDNVEYIIIDGGSTDGTLDIIKKYEDKIDYWGSEKDNGISDAFNKGIAYASGEIIGIINSDDWYDIDALSYVAKVFLTHPECEVLCGSMKLYTEEVWRVLHSRPRLLWTGMTVVHPATFVRAKVYRSFGLFDVTLKYAMDYDLLLRFYTSSVKFFACEHYILSNMRSGGVANTHRIEAYNEVITIAKRYNFYVVIYIMYSIRKIVWNAKNIFKLYLLRIGSK